MRLYKLIHCEGVRIAISYNENDTFNDNVLVNGIEVGPVGYNTYSVTLPAGKVCDKCVLQWIWDSTADGG